MLYNRRSDSLSLFLFSQKVLELLRQFFLPGQGRGKKWVTEDPKPVGSGRFRDQSRDAEAVPALFLALLIQHLPPSVSLLRREVNSRHPCLRSGNVIFPIMDDSMSSSFCSQTPTKRERITYAIHKLNAPAWKRRRRRKL